MKKPEKILQDGIDAYNSRVSDLNKFKFTKYEFEMFVGLMEEYASQSKPEERLFEVAIFFYRRGFFEEKSEQFDKHFDEFNKHSDEFNISKPQEIEWLSKIDEIQNEIDNKLVRYSTEDAELHKHWSIGISDACKHIQSELQKRIKPVDTKTVEMYSADQINYALSELIKISNKKRLDNPTFFELLCEPIMGVDTKTEE